jgi:hypothetical protein
MNPTAMLFYSVHIAENITAFACAAACPKFNKPMLSAPRTKQSDIQCRNVRSFAKNPLMFIFGSIISSWQKNYRDLDGYVCKISMDFKLV